MKRKIEEVQGAKVVQVETIFTPTGEQRDYLYQTVVRLRFDNGLEFIVNNPTCMNWPQ